jgi:hypothetical protein
MKTNQNGVEQWTKTYGGPEDDTAYSVIQDSMNNDLVITGKTENFGSGAYVLAVCVKVYL